MIHDQPHTRVLSGRQIAQAAGVVVLGFVLSRVLGLVREAVISAVFGAGSAYDAYAAALQIPDTLFFVVAGGAIGSAFIPTFASYLARGDSEGAWQMASSVINLFVLVMLVIAGLCMVFAHPIVVYTVAQGFPAETQDLTVRLMRIMLLSPIIFGLSGIFMGVLNANQRFLLPALAPSFYNIGIIIGATVIRQALGGDIFGLAWGVVLGALLHLLVQVPGVARVGSAYRLALQLRHPGVLEVSRLMGPRILGQAIVQVNFWVNKMLASGMAEGSVGTLQRAWFLLMLPQGVIAQSVATAVFPTFSAQVAENRQEELRETLEQVLRTVLFLSIPASAGLVLLRLPIVRLMYERGEFPPQGSEAVAWALLFYGLGLVAHSLVEIITRAFYAMHDTRTPVLIGGLAMALNVGLSFALIGVIGDPENLARGAFAGLALANTMATTLEGLLLFGFIWRRVNGFNSRRMVLSLSKACIASLGMGVVLELGKPFITVLGQYLGPLLGVMAGGLVFWGLAEVLRSEEIRYFRRIALSRLKRGDGQSVK
nr:murein biosynthesis integral membrane protein MurJ [Anaerolineae bacterium]